MPHAGDLEGVFLGLLVEAVLEADQGGVGAAELVNRGLHPLLGLVPRGPCIAFGLIRRLLVDRNVHLGNELGLVRFRPSCAALVFEQRRVFHVDDEVGFNSFRLEDLEAVDVAGIADQGDVGASAFLAGFDVGDVSRAGDGPGSRVAGYEVEDALLLRQHDDGGVPDPGLDRNVLIEVFKVDPFRGLRRGREQE